MRSKRLHLGLADASTVFWAYLKRKTFEQVRIVLPLVLLLLFFQVVILGMTPTAAGATAIGVVLVIFGLAFFLEGIRLSIMPLGEEVGLHLPVKAGVVLSLLFGFIVGIGATLAEPAIGVLRVLGASLNAWDAPLLYVLLNRHASLLVLVIGAGVGLAVALSLIRSFFNWPLKPFVVTVVPIVLGVTVWSYLDPNLRLIAGLAWDAGGVTTGPVTVPLIVSLGLGVSRALKHEESATSGLGLVTLASLLPILAVLLLGIGLLPHVPEPMDEDAFFGPEHREDVLELFEAPADFQAYAQRHDVTVELEDSDTDDSPADSPAGDESVAPDETVSDDNPALNAAFNPAALKTQLLGAARSILPLVAVLIVVLAVFLRRSVDHWDEVFLGIGVTLVGMVLLNVGIQEGLSRLGRGVGTRLPATFQSINLSDEQERLERFDPGIVQRAVAPDGRVHRFFYLQETDGVREIPFSPDRYDVETGTYTYVPSVGPLVVLNDSRDSRGSALCVAHRFYGHYGGTGAVRVGGRG